MTLTNDFCSGSNGPEGKILPKEYENCDRLQNERLRGTAASDVQ